MYFFFSSVLDVEEFSLHVPTDTEVGVGATERETASSTWHEKDYEQQGDVSQNKKKNEKG